MRPPALSCALLLLVLASVRPSLAVGQAQPRSLPLMVVGAPRELPLRMLGASAPPLLERLLDDPRKVAGLQATAPGVLRFPGGSQANYYNWRTGLLEIESRYNSSASVKFWAGLAPKIARAFPRGIRYDDYHPFATKVGADVILVPNLETSTIEEQAAWFRDLAAKGILPRHIELGNEFYLAMLADPASLARWPDVTKAMEVMRQYERALRPLVGKGAKFAVQSAGSPFWVDPHATWPFQRRMLEWDAGLAAAEWFEAITVHLYPVPRQLSTLPGGNSPAGLLALLLGRADAGVDRTIGALSRQVPGKEIWVTEWNPRGGEPPDGHAAEVVTPGIAAHTALRMSLSLLRHPEVTRALYFMLNFSSGAWQAYTDSFSGRYEPLPATAILGWLHAAANSGGTFERIVEAGAEPVRVPASGEQYRGIEGGLFRRPGHTSMILHNATTEMRQYDQTANGNIPRRVEVISTPDLASLERYAAQVVSLDPSKPLRLPPYSAARIVWE